MGGGTLAYFLRVPASGGEAPGDKGATNGGGPLAVAYLPATARARATNIILHLMIRIAKLNCRPC
jgi:hypothetical protein